jgi:hypothetical protein
MTDHLLTVAEKVTVVLVLVVFAAILLMFLFRPVSGKQPVFHHQDRPLVTSTTTDPACTPFPYVVRGVAEIPGTPGYVLPDGCLP